MFDLDSVFGKRPNKPYLDFSKFPTPALNNLYDYICSGAVPKDEYNDSFYWLAEDIADELTARGDTSHLKVGGESDYPFILDSDFDENIFEDDETDEGQDRENYTDTQDRENYTDEDDDCDCLERDSGL